MPELAVGVAALLVVLADAVEGLTHGRTAEEGEFPSVVRISLLRAIGSKESTRVATGVLVTTTQILTTCDSVGFLNVDRVRPFRLELVTIQGGTITKDGGIKKTPKSSRVHERCHFLPTGIVLFNLGIYEIDKPFADGLKNDKLVRPVENFFTSAPLMRKVLKKLWTEFELRQAPSFHCSSAGWGHPVRIYEGRGEPDDSQAFSETLQVANMTVVGYDYCAKMSCKHFDQCFISIFEYGLVCAQAEFGGPCRNDRGAPLFCNHQIFALLTNPQACSKQPIPRHFVRIDLVYDFVFGGSKSSRSRRSVALSAATAVIIIRSSSW